MVRSWSSFGARMAILVRTDMNLVTVAAKPKSGTTWLCWILAEICDGATPVGGGKKTATSGIRVQRTHSGPDKGMEYGVVVLTRRDPRDVVCSMKRSWPNKSHLEYSRGLCKEWVPMLNAWRAFDPAPIETSYEVLRLDGIAEVKRLAVEVFEKEINDAEAQRCLDTFKPKRSPSNVGDWRMDLDLAAIELIHATLGDQMTVEGYAISL